MGRQLLDEEPAFRSAIEACDAAIAARTGWSVIAELRASRETSRLAQIEVVQPVLFALSLALAELWRAWGVEPHAVVGHSMGEVAAACVSGALSLADGAMIVCERSALLRRITGRGEMAVVELPVAETQSALRGFEDRLAVAVRNSRHSTVISGDPGALAEVLAALEVRGVFCRRVKVDVASHGPQVDPLLDDLVTALSGLTARSPRIPMRSTVTSALVGFGELSARYWANNLRRPVEFAPVVESLVSEGFTLFVEMSPHPLLVSAVQAIRQAADAGGVAVGSLRREQGERLTLLESLGALHTHGHALDARRLFPSGGSSVELPTYPWQRASFWIEPPTPRGASEEHRGFAGVRIRAAGRDAVYESVLSVRQPSWLASHRVAGTVVVPGAALLELARAAAEAHRGGPSLEVGDLVLRAPLEVAEGGACRVQVVLTENGTLVSVYGQAVSAGPTHAFTLHASAVITDAPAGPPSPIDLTAVRARCAEPVDTAAMYASFAGDGLEYGPEFQTVRALWRGDGEVLAHVELGADLSGGEFGVHPALLDGAFQAVVGLLPDERQHGPLVPFQIERFRVHTAGVSSALVQARLIEPSAGGSLVAEVTLTDASGELVARASGLHLRAASHVAASTDTASLPDAFYRLDWVKVPVGPRSTAVRESWAVVTVGDEKEAESLLAALSEGGAPCERVGLAELADVSADHVACIWGATGDAQAAIRAAHEGLAVLHALHGHRKPPRLWWLTRGAVAVAPDDDAAAACATIWGLGRTVMHEHPELRCTLLDLDPAASTAEEWLAELSADDDEDQIAWRKGQRWAPRLARAPAPRGRGRALRPEGTVLVTGGGGALGVEVLRVLAGRGVRHLVLIGRRAPTPALEEVLTELRALGSQVTVAAVDVTDREALARLLATVTLEWPLRGVVHLAGVLDDGVLAAQTAERFSRVMMPKVAGAWHLHELTAHADLDLFVLFSSVSGTLGSAGQGGYASANTFLDALASHRHAIGLAATSLAWGPWAERGLAAALDESQHARMARLGVEMLSMREGRALFADAIARPEAQLVVARIDPSAIVDSQLPIPPLWRVLVPRRSNTGPVHRSAETPPSWALELASRPAPERADAVNHLVRSEVARVLSFGSARSVPLDRPLKELGFDSLMAVELRNALARRTGLSLPGTLVFHHPTVQAIADHLLGRADLASSGLAHEGDERVAYGENLCPVIHPKARIFCFHDAGGSAAMFAPFCELAEHGVEVHAVSHVRRAPAGEAMAARYLREAVDYVRRFSDAPCALFGHSLGGALAWRVVQELEGEGAPLPVVLALSASAFPRTMGGDFSGDDLAEAFSIIVGHHAAAADYLRSDFNADVWLWRALPPRAQEPLSVPIAAFLGRDDHVASESAMNAWSRLTTREFSLNIVPGGHFYLRDEAARRLVQGRVLALLEQAAGPITDPTGRDPDEPRRS
jgi:acyl transferase domain-containing protein/surfactin synthase thioesterase subunit/acyl carrier protein